MTRRFQFSLRTMLWLMVCVACFFAGRRSQVADIVRKEREALAEREASLDAREEAAWRYETANMKAWHQLKTSRESVVKSRDELMEMGRMQARAERDGKIIRQTLEMLRSSPESSARVELLLPDGRRWQAPDDAFEQAQITDAEAPKEKPSARLRQLKDLARRFRVNEIWKDNSRIELRLLIQPVYRYTDPVRDIQDGAVFIFAHGTNPETILFIEARGKSLTEARWNYSLVRSTSAELHVTLDEREVWSCPRADGTNRGPGKTHWIFELPIEAAPLEGAHAEGN